MTPDASPPRYTPTETQWVDAELVRSLMHTARNMQVATWGVIPLLVGVMWEGVDPAGLAAIDARMGEVYTGAFLRHGGTLAAIDAERVRAPDAVALPAGHEGDWQGVGTGFAAAAGVLRIPPVAPVPLALPDFNGRLRLMAVAWDRTRVGRGEAHAHALEHMRVRRRVEQVRRRGRPQEVAQVRDEERERHTRGAGFYLGPAPLADQRHAAGRSVVRVQPGGRAAHGPLGPSP